MLQKYTILTLFFITLSIIIFSGVGNGFTNNYYASIILSLFCLPFIYFFREDIFNKKNFFLYASIFLSSLTISCLLSDNINGYVWYRYYAILICMLFGYLTYLFLLKYNIEFIFFIKIFSIIGFLNVIALLYFWYSLEDPYNYNWMMGIPFSNHIRNFTDYIAITAICSIFLAVTTKDKEKFIFYVITIFILALLFWSGSRSSILGLLVGVFFILIYLDNKFKNLSLILLMSLLSLFISTFYSVNSYGLGIFKSINRSMSGSINQIASYRFDIYSKAIGLIQEKPFWGYGGEAVRDYIIHIHGMKIGQAHNSIIQIILEFGFIGLITLIIFILSIIKGLNFNKLNIDNSILIAVVLVIFSSSLFNGGFYYVSILSVFCMFVGLMFHSFSSKKIKDD